MKQWNTIQELKTEPFQYGWGLTGPKTAGKLAIAGLSVVLAGAMYKKVVTFGLLGYIPLIAALVIWLAAWGRRRLGSLESFVLPTQA